ncbi:uncharacterized protein LOC129582421 [Paramacrobiotus metropolitanus]|uniref:uncharacterized protein LOC129582421 n=1 Tax=Paramacrobiotus metropolitanus TaxID=2943436 RepID=UPI0024459EE5|nr:uncharacterized protein LOC129582421 [Paramacrobiotus metropolitanus]
MIRRSQRERKIQIILSKEIQVLRLNCSALNYPVVEMTLNWSFAEPNRVLKRYHPDMLLSVCFQNLHFKPAERTENEPTVNRNNEVCKYIKAVLENGIRVNGREFNFFVYSESQLKKRTCLMFAASNEECWAEWNRLGDFSKLTSAAKVAKRLGQLLSSAQPVFRLPWKGKGHEDGYPVEDDIVENGQNFTDGCGWISPRLMQKVAHASNLRFDERLLVPSVIQIRYRGFKGVLAVNPSITSDVVFRKSQEKFPCEDDSFCVVQPSGTSRPYIYGKLNQQIVALLSALGIPDEALLEVQEEHYQRLENMYKDPVVAFKVLSGEGKQREVSELAEKGFQSKKVTDALNAVRSHIMHKSVKEKNNGDKTKLSVVVEESRFVFAVNDPNETEDGQLREGDVYFAPTIDGVATPLVGNLVLVRNPCLFPGDILLRQAVENPGCRHLVDCVVFPVQGRRSTASCSGGGDLDGDKFTVIWDKRLIPQKMQEPYGYPPAQQKQAKKIDRDAMIKCRRSVV